MPLSAGDHLGSYEILAPIGAGGMGEVHRARDTKLKRDVAIKILPETFAHDPERLARFHREAEVLASLNHPNIAAIYGVVEDRALVMELVEGQSPKGPMAFDDAWKIASQIAAALEYAHDKGVVHRDLKPANIKVTPEGAVKLLDFGLAKAFSTPREAQTSTVENSPTLTLAAATEMGMIMGTAAYMAPEQAKGKSVDKRADIWSFGVVLYELLSGERLFKGEDAADTLGQVLAREPDLERVPVQARKLLRRCLEKDPRLRLRDIGDARDLLEERIAAPSLSRSRLGIGASIAATVLFVALGIVSFLYFRQAPPQKALLRYTLAAPENTTDIHSFAISPDGRMLALAAEVNSRRQLWLRPLDALQAQPIPGTDDATYPFWSPDSRYIGYFAQGGLRKIAASGGPAQSISEVTQGQGGSWNRADVIIFSPALNTGTFIQRVSASGGLPANVILAKAVGLARLPIFLPDGHRFLYVYTGVSAEMNGVNLSSLDGKENRRVLTDASSVFLARGRLLFVRENTLMAQSFDAASGKIVGEAVPVAEGVYPTTFNYAPVTVSETGVLVYKAGGATGGNNQMAWFDRGGKLLRLVGAPGPVLDPAISPDEKTVVFRRGSLSQSDLWLRELDRGAEQRFTTDSSVNFAPSWSPAGDRIVFTSTRSGSLTLYEKAANGSGKDEPLLDSGNGKIVSQWSRDGRFAVYSEIDLKTKLDIWVLPMEPGKERKPVPFLRSEFNELMGQLSPDSHWMAYTSDESRQREVYVRPFPAGEGQWKISIAGGEQPRWRSDGKEIFFVAGDRKMMAVAVKAPAGARPSFEAGAPQPLFDTHLAQSPANNLFEYDVTADGQRFLLDTAGLNIGATGPASAPVLNVVVNWETGLKK